MPTRGRVKAKAVARSVARVHRKEREMARALLTTNLAWRVELVQPTAAMNLALIEAARHPELAQQMIGLIMQVKRDLKVGDPRLMTRLYYTGWGLKELEHLAWEVKRG